MGPLQPGRIGTVSWGATDRPETKRESRKPAGVTSHTSVRRATLSDAMNMKFSESPTKYSPANRFVALPAGGGNSMGSTVGGVTSTSEIPGTTLRETPCAAASTVFALSVKGTPSRQLNGIGTLTTRWTLCCRPSPKIQRAVHGPDRVIVVFHRPTPLVAL